MKSDLELLSERKARLVARAQAERLHLRSINADLGKPVQLVDQCIRLFKSPFVLTAITTLVMKSRWRKYAKWPSLIWKGWSMFRVYQAYRKG